MILFTHPDYVNGLVVKSGTAGIRVSRGQSFEAQLIRVKVTAIKRFPWLWVCTQIDEAELIFYVMADAPKTSSEVALALSSTHRAPRSANMH